MYIIGARFTNFKSFSASDNILQVDKGKTTIIGVNESGKSNILELLGKLDFTKPLSNEYSLLKNINKDDNIESSIDIYLQLSEQECLQLDVDGSENTILHFSIGERTTIEGQLHSLIEQDTVMINAIQLFEEALQTDNVEVKGNGLKDYNNRLELLKCASHQIIDISSLNEIVKHIKVTADQEKYKNGLESAKKQLQMYYNMLPCIVYRTARDLIEIKSIYSNLDAQKELTDSKSALYLLVKAAGVEITDMQQAFAMSDTDARASKHRIIEAKIKKNVCDVFKKYFHHENYDLEIKFETNKLYTRVITGDNCISITERSNGLRWYFGLFLQLVAQDYTNRNVIYILDEPGVFLHINAQKELISLFNKLIDSGNQVVYSTHLPSMLNLDNLQCIRRVEKDDIGTSHIFQTFYGKGLKNNFRQDTLAPLLQAMGCDLKNTGIDSNRLNIVTEGPTDRLYLEAGLKIINVPEMNRPNIIAAQGASNVKHIWAILMGWGCKYMALFDYDRDGFKEYNKMITKYGDKISDRICMVFQGNIPTDVNDKSINKKTIENLISNNLNEKLSVPYDGTNETKMPAALEFREKILNDKIKADEETFNNYCQLFKRLGII